MIPNFLPSFYIIMLYILNRILSDDQIDADHLKQYPYCGRLFGYRSNKDKVNSRVVNSEDSVEHDLYPWVVYIERRILSNINQPIHSICGGTVIAYRHVVSAGHCICNLLRHQPDAHQDSLCRPTFPALPMNQIVHGYNQIRVYGGSKDTKVLLSKSNKANRFSVERAILWDTISDPKTEVFLEKPDVGILFTARPLFDRDYLLKTLNIFQLANDYRPPILPICLGKEDYNFDDQDLHGVGWGMTYHEYPKESNPRDPFYSSCMTNEIGKEKWRFKACNMKQIQKLNWSCQKTELPPNISPEEYLRCRKYFKTARRMFQQTDKSNLQFFDRVRKIFVYKGKAPKKNFDSKKRLVCYKKQEFTERGWCEVRGHSKSKNAWGFCSPSCNQQLMQAGPQDSYPNIYQDFKWKADNSPDNKCTKGFLTWNPDFMVCAKATLPQADVGIFEIIKGSDELKFVSFEKEYPPEYIQPDFETSYIATCYGDSGSGHWITIDKDHAKPWKIEKLGLDIKMSQRVLVAILMRSWQDKRNSPIDGMGACGGDVSLDDGKWVVTVPAGTKTTNPQILEFFKLHAEISQNNR